MSRLFRTNSVSSNSSNINKIPDVVNEEQIEYETVSEIGLKDWNIPKIPIKEIYRKNWSLNSFKSTTHVKTVEQVYALSKEHETCQLLNLESIKKHRKDGNNFLHIGLVQVAVKPLTRNGLNASILLCLRDGRFTNFPDSLLGVIESSLFNGPVHFDCFPDFTVSLNDPHILKILTLNIKTSGYQVLPGSQPLALVYRIYYKVTGTNMNFQALNKSPKDQTLLIQSCQSNANIKVPQSIKWSEVTFPPEWTLATENQPPSIQNTSSNLEFIQQYLDGTVKIAFTDPSPRSNVQLKQLPTPSQSQRINPTRHSFSASSSTLERDLEMEKSIIDLKLEALRKNAQVSQPCYSPSKKPSQSKEPIESKPNSPTQTDFEGSLPQYNTFPEVQTFHHQLRVLNKKFKIHWKTLDKHLEAPENANRRNVYRIKYPTKVLRLQIFEEWKKYMLEEESEIYFLDFLEEIFEKSNTVKTLTWVKEDNTETTSSHPPAETIIINHKNTQIKASPFKLPETQPTDQVSYPSQSLLNDKRIIEQNNYTNQSLIVVGKQLDKIEEKFDKVLSQEKHVVKSTSDFPLEKPLVNFQEIKLERALKINPRIEKIDQLMAQLKGKTIKNSEVPKITTLQTPHSDSETLSQNSESSSQQSKSTDISHLENTFNDLQVNRLKNKVNPMSLTKNWYPRPTPPDIQYEEKPFQNQFTVSSDKLYEWNIDGLSEQEILNKLQHMSMVANSYFTNHNLRQSEIVNLLETGFTGTLRVWWDNHLTEESKLSIIHAVKQNENGFPIFDEDAGIGVEDGVNTLLYTIIKHFIGTPSNTTQRIHDQLSNLRCPKLGDFRWYKDVFISRVMLREDSNQSYWKEKFVNGLPNLFAHKIRTVLSKDTGTINYNELTYGDLISTINQVGMKMCVDLRINKQVQNETKSAKYELGTFCEQYGLIPPPPSKVNKRKIHKNYPSKRKFFPKNKRFNDNNEFYKRRKFTKKKNWSKQPNQNKKKNYNKKKVECFKCKKTGHYANECPVKNTIKQLKISEEEKTQLIKVLELRNSDSEEIHLSMTSSGSDYSSSSDYESNSPQIQFGCKDNCCNTKTISVLTKIEEQEELLIDLISKIDNPELKFNYLKKLKKLMSQTEESSHQTIQTPTISLTTTLEKFNQEKEITIHDLQLEIKNIKKEIISLRQTSHKLQNENLEIKQDLISLSEKFGSSSKNLFENFEFKSDSEDENSIKDNTIALIKQVNFRKWYSKVKIFIKDFELTIVALFDSGADLNCIQEGLIPTKYYKKSKESLGTASGKKLQLNYEIPKAHVCQNNVCFKTSFVLIKDITDAVILGLPFISLLYPFKVEYDGVTTSQLGEQIKFDFLRKPELRALKNLQSSAVSKTLNLIQRTTQINVHNTQTQIMIPKRTS